MTRVPRSYAEALELVKKNSVKHFDLAIGYSMDSYIAYRLYFSSVNERHQTYAEGAD